MLQAKLNPIFHQVSVALAISSLEPGSLWRPCMLWQLVPAKTPTSGSSTKRRREKNGNDNQEELSHKKKKLDHPVEKVMSPPRASSTKVISQTDCFYHVSNWSSDGDPVTYHVICGRLLTFCRWVSTKL